ncbi:hypothetical protein RintRC_0619 [Richelia intracellularis]|nr:hypothetical protein RintRC_0619 [Richelia intracellularis]
MKGPEAVLPLGFLYISGDWDEYWQFHLQQEHKRNHLALYSSGIPLIKQVLKAKLLVLLPLHLFQYLSKFHSPSYKKSRTQFKSVNITTIMKLLASACCSIGEF